MTTVQMFKILGLLCLSTAYSLSVMYLEGVKLGDMQVCRRKLGHRVWSLRRICLTLTSCQHRCGADCVPEADYKATTAQHSSLLV